MNTVLFDHLMRDLFYLYDHDYDAIVNKRHIIQVINFVSLIGTVLLLSNLNTNHSFYYVQIEKNRSG